MERAKLAKFEIKKIFNQYLKVKCDPCNTANLRNIDLFDSLLMGNSQTPQFSYLINLEAVRTKDIRSLAAFNDANIAPQINAYKRYEEEEDGKTIYLKDDGELLMPLGECLKIRKSTRKFAPNPLGFDDFSTLCKYSFGQSERKEEYGGIKVSCRYYASGGGIYPLQIFLYVNNVNSIENGLYRYQPSSHSLYPIRRDFDVSRFLNNDKNFDLKNFSLLVIYEYDVNKNYLKYGELSLLLTFIEVGIISHNFELCSSALKCGACQIGGFDKHYAENMLNLDGFNSHVIFTNICGSRR